MKQLHCGNSNAGYGQSFSLCETMFEYAVHRHVTLMFHTVYSIGQNVAWPDLGRAGVGCTRFLHKQVTLATRSKA